MTHIFEIFLYYDVNIIEHHLRFFLINKQCSALKHFRLKKIVYSELTCNIFRSKTKSNNTHS